MKNLLFAFCIILLDVLGCGKKCDEPYLSVNPNSMFLESRKGSSNTISVSSNTHWKVTSNCEEWLEVYPKSGDGNAEIAVTTKSSNESIDVRNCTMIIECETITLAVFVHQKGK